MKALDLHITDACNVLCAACSQGIPLLAQRNEAPYHMTVEEIAEARRRLPGDFPINVTGGEPTLHPEFPRILQAIRHAFPRNPRVLFTNGAKVEEHFHDIISTFQRVVLTRYPGHPIPRRAGLLPGIDIRSSCHIDPTQPSGISPEECRFLGRAMLRAGHVYPCARVFGLRLHHGDRPEDAGVPIGRWKDTSEPWDCKRCWTIPFSIPAR